MKEKIQFFFKFIKNPLRNASLIESSKVTDMLMLEGINFQKVKVIFELGTGQGNFLEELLKKVSPETKIYSIEIDPDYVSLLNRKFSGTENLKIIQGSAEDFLDISKKENVEKIDLIVSSVPFLYGQKQDKFVKSLIQVTNNGVIFRFLTYMPRIMKNMYQPLPVTKKYFSFRNFPPVWIFGVN